jgi:hypothetical protein
MKTLQISALMLALSLCSTVAHAQQEIDPDHFDRPSVGHTHAKGSGMASNHKRAVHHGTNVRIAHNHSRDTHHLQGRRA